MEVKSGYKQTEVGVIPEGWEVHPFGKIAHIERGKFTARPRNDPKYYGGDIPFIQTGDVTNADGYITTYSQTLNAAGLKVSKLFPRGTLFFTIAANIGDVGFATFDAACPDSLVAIAPTKNTDKIWLYYELAKRKSFFESIATHNAQLNINLEKLRPYLLPHPPLPEQRAIAEVLSDVDGLLGGLDRLIAKKRDLKQAAMQQLLKGRTRLPGFHGEWEETPLRELGQFLKGNGVRKEQTRSGSLACVRYGELYTHHNYVIHDFNSWISTEVASTAVRLRKGDILFAGSGETKEEIGKCAAFNSDIEAYAGGDIVILRPHEADAIFLGYFLNTESINRQKASRGQGDAVVHISSSSLGAIRCRIPKPSEQTAIAEVLTEMDMELAALEQQREKTRAIKQGMMQQLLTGQIRLVKPEQAEANA